MIGKKIIENKYIVLVAVFMLVFSLASVFFALKVNNSRVVGIWEFNASLIVDSTPGFDLDNQKLTFGAVSPGGASTRALKVQNDNNFIVNTQISCSGDISKFLFFENNIALSPHETRNISISAIVPLNSNFRNYSGVVRATLTKYG